jgi:hypothetical protein
VDVVVPFRGTPAALKELQTRLSRLRLEPGDSLAVVDNTPGRGARAESGGEGVLVMQAAALQTPGYARNRGVAAGRAEWLLFLDADVLAPEDLIERYFDPPASERTALVAGGVIDEPAPRDSRLPPRWAQLQRSMSQDHTFRLEEWAFPQSSNLVCRRSAFEAAGGFRENIRAGEDADLTYRLKAAGWEIERRESATVVHRSRQTVRAFIAQKALHGSGGAWLDHEYPGSFPPRRRPGLVWWGVRRATKGLLSAAWSRDSDEAVRALFDPLEQLAREFGRSLPNERPLPDGSLWTRVRFLREDEGR